LNFLEDKMKLPLSASFMVAIAAAALGVGSPARAATIIDEWGSVKAEPAPALALVTVDVKTTALIVMDLVKGSCNDQRRPRCVAQIPAIAKLLNAARAKGMTVIDTTAGSGPVEDILPPVAPKAGETVLTGTDKFIRTDLEKILKDKGMTTVITVGTSAQGAVLYTASGAALRGLKVIVPVDGSSSESLYAEQAAAWLLSHAPGVAQQVTLTTIDMIKF
jgi:nicotinamidase-related amidase